MTEPVSFVVGAAMTARSSLMTEPVSPVVRAAMTARSSLGALKQAIRSQQAVFACMGIEPTTGWKLP
jgi:hypothetical protein